MPANASSSTSHPPINGDVSSLQKWAQNAHQTLTEHNLQLSRINNLVKQLITLNNLKSKA